MAIDEGIRRRVFAEIEAHQDEMIGFLGQLVKIPSLTGLERDAQLFMAETFSTMGLEMDVFDADEVKGLREHIGFFETTAYREFGYKNRPNVVGTLRGQGGGRSLILCGHIDVVSPEPLNAWKYKPWGGIVDGGRLYGRGSMDMKGGIAVMTYVLKALLSIGVKLKGDLLLVTTIEEEAGGVGGALATILRGHRADAAVLTEPHYNIIATASGGVIYFRVKVPGKTAHAYQAHIGVNAIFKAMKIVEALSKLNEDRQQRISYPLAENIAPHMQGHATTLNIGKLTAGDWPSTVPGSAVLECRMGYPTGSEDLQDVMREIVETVKKAAAMDNWLKDHAPVIEWFGWRSRPHEQDIGHPIVQMVKGYAEEIIGEPVSFTGGHAGNDGRFFVLYGNIPAVLFGPRGESAHGCDEYVELDSLVGASKVLALTVLDWCGYQ